MKYEFLNPTIERVNNIVFSKKYNEEYYVPYLTVDGRYKVDNTHKKILKNHFDFLYDLVLEEYLIVPKYESSLFDQVKWRPSFYFMQEIFDIPNFHKWDESDYIVFAFKPKKDDLFLELKKDQSFQSLLFCCEGISGIFENSC